MPKLLGMAHKQPLSSSSAGASAGRYTPVAMLLHWVMALGLIGLVGFGLYMTSLPFSPTRLKWKGKS